MTPKCASQLRNAKQSGFTNFFAVSTLLASAIWHELPSLCLLMVNGVAGTLDVDRSLVIVLPCEP